MVAIALSLAALQRMATLKASAASSSSTSVVTARRGGSGQGAVMPIGIRTRTGTSTICGSIGSGIGWFLGSVPQPVNAAENDRAKRSDALRMRLRFIFDVLNSLVELQAGIAGLGLSLCRGAVGMFDAELQLRDGSVLLRNPVAQRRNRLVAEIRCGVPAPRIGAGQIELDGRSLCRRLGGDAIMPLPAPETEQRRDDQTGREPSQPAATRPDPSHRAEAVQRGERRGDHSSTFTSSRSPGLTAISGANSLLSLIAGALREGSSGSLASA